MQNSIDKRPKKSPPARSGELLGTVLRCKWSLTVYQLIADKVVRPGEMVRRVDGLSTKVLNDCLKVNVRIGVLSKESFPVTPPRVEYSFTPLGHRLIKVVSDLYAIESEMMESESEEYIAI